MASNGQQQRPMLEDHGGGAGQAGGGGGRDLIDVVNDLQSKVVAAGQSLDFNLPQIAVVGSQSSGKSSVLESIVGKEFLPRGTGVVTRRPILIQLYPTTTEEYGIFGHKPNERFFDFSQIRQEILNQMPEKNRFTSVPIPLKIYSRRALKLTLVDLPGIVKVAVAGQPDSNVREVQSMVLSYIRPKECIILAVTPASQDLATSDALEIAAQVDPERTRTIGVLTKPDLMDQGTDACEILKNKQVVLKRGYLVVLNRSLMDITNGRDIPHGLEQERIFFESRECYREWRHRCGIPNLQKELQLTLRQHIREALPEVRNQLAQKLYASNQQLKAIKQKIGGGPNNRKLYMIKLINSFITDLKIKLLGHSELVDSTSLSPGVLINYKLYTEVQQKLNLRLVPDIVELTILLTNIEGFKESISLSTHALDAMCRKLMSEFDTPMEQSVYCVQRILLQTIEEAATKLDQYPSTKNEILFRIRRSVDQATDRTLERLQEHVKAEMFFVNIKHPDMDLKLCDQLYPPIGPSKTWEVTMPEESNPESGEPVENGVTGIDAMTRPLVDILMRNASVHSKVQYVMVVIAKYMEIVQKQISDLTIKYICYFLIGKVLDFIKLELVPGLLTSGNLNSLTEDCEDDFQLKEEIETKCRVFQDALDAIHDF